MSLVVKDSSSQPRLALFVQVEQSDGAHREQVHAPVRAVAVSFADDGIPQVLQLFAAKGQIGQWKGVAIAGGTFAWSGLACICRARGSRGCSSWSGARRFGLGWGTA